MGKEPTEVLVYSIGHSQHSLVNFADLLRPFGINLVVDVRSFPGSRFAQEFSREGLDRRLPQEGIRYAFLGDKLGGRPSKSAFYDGDGRVLYGRLAADSEFQAGVLDVEEWASSYTVALMCSEGRPEGCHRHLLIEPVLAMRRVSMLHIRPQGGVYDMSEIAPQPALFVDQDEDSWKSTRSVSQGAARRTSSRP